MTRIGINGLGRIGRMVFRAAAARTDVLVVAANDLLPADHLAYLLRYDSVHGRFSQEIEAESSRLVIDGRSIPVTNETDPAKIDWGASDIDVVIESTGVFLTYRQVEGHLRTGAGKVIISAPPADDTPIYVFGINSDSYSGETVISAASCTTCCLAPMAKVLYDSFGIRRGLMTTVHATTASQNTVDGPSGKDWRFGRSILENIIPASTGAARAIGKVIPDLAGKLTGIAFRVPTADVSIVDLTCELVREADYADVCQAMKLAADGPLNGILAYTGEPVVSTDLRGASAISIFDAGAGLQLDRTFLKVVAWYDNEWGYACKLLDLAGRIA